MSHIVQKLLEYVEDNKDKMECFRDNEYLSTLDFLKRSYENIKLKENPKIHSIYEYNIKLYAVDEEDNKHYKILHIKHKYELDEKTYISYDYRDEGFYDLYGIYVNDEKTILLSNIHKCIDTILNSQIYTFQDFVIDYNGDYNIFRKEQFFKSMEDKFEGCNLRKRFELYQLWKNLLRNTIIYMIFN